MKRPPPLRTFATSVDVFHLVFYLATLGPVAKSEICKETEHRYGPFGSRSRQAAVISICERQHTGPCVSGTLEGTLGQGRGVEVAVTSIRANLEGILFVRTAPRTSFPFMHWYVH